MPPLDGATGWVNSDPLGPADLRGHVVLVNFWTWTCINWLRQEPYVRAWAQAYRDDGLVVIGVHTPEFSFEHDVEGVRRATAERAIGARDPDAARCRARARVRRRARRGGGSRLGASGDTPDLSRLLAGHGLRVLGAGRAGRAPHVPGAAGAAPQPLG